MGYRCSNSLHTMIIINMDNMVCSLEISAINFIGSIIQLFNFKNVANWWANISSECNDMGELPVLRGHSGHWSPEQRSRSLESWSQIPIPQWTMNTHLMRQLSSFITRALDIRLVQDTLGNPWHRGRIGIWHCNRCILYPAAQYSYSICFYARI